MGKALYEESIRNNGLLQVCSMYDEQQDASDNPYFPAELFRGFGINKIKFIRQMVREGRNSDVVILSHINLLLIGLIIKNISPKTKLILLGHGIEIWYPVTRLQKKMLHYCEQIWAVSHYTKKKIMEAHKVPGRKCHVLNNCLDPFLPLPSITKKNPKLLAKYGFKESDFVLMTLTRLSSKERYKGYDVVIQALAQIMNEFPELRYLIAGTFDDAEKVYVEQLIQKYHLQQRVVIPGYIPDEELQDHFGMSDLYVMPSRKEGFGIVFIEAMYYGLPVIAGNEDGSCDALLDGKLGQLVNPLSVEDISNAISNIIKNSEAFKPDHPLLLQHFSYEIYKNKMDSIMTAHQKTYTAYA